MCRDLQACLDGCDMRAGDGKFINCSCHPNVWLDLGYRTSIVHPGAVEEDHSFVAIINLITPMRYAISQIFLHVVTSRTIFPFQQLSLSYEKPSRKNFALDRLLGGAVNMMDCTCGYVFCCGDMLRRLHCNMLQESDRYFFKNVVGPVEINLGMIMEANKLWYAISSHPRDMSEVSKLEFLGAHFTRQSLPRAASLYNNYVNDGLNAHNLPHYMSTMMK